jgi:hypothetical protein
LDRVYGEFAATGVVPRYFEELREFGIEPPIHLLRNPKRSGTNGR